MTSETPKSSRSAYRAGHLLVGKYLLGRLLGEGGSGHVWLAHNIDLAAPVALKLLRTDVDAKDAPDRLKREAQATARLEHPAIVRVFDCGKTELGHPFMVMELLEGKTLAEVMDKQGTMSAAAAVQLLLPIVDALSMAHAKSVVHRDIKPENIFLAQEARRIQPKLVDFGIAKVEEEARERITSTGTVLGSPSYMAPEQALGVPDVDHRADIWAIAMVLYETVAGRRSSQSARGMSPVAGVLLSDVPPLRDERGRETNLWWVLERALRRDRQQRLDSMRTLGNELAGFLLAEGVTHDVCGESIASNWDVSGADTKPGSVARSIGSAGVRVAPHAPGPALLPALRGAPGDGLPHSSRENTLVSRYEPEASVRPEEPPPVSLVVPPARRRSPVVSRALIATALLAAAAIASGKPAMALQAALGMGFFGPAMPATTQPTVAPRHREAAWTGAFDPAPTGTQCTTPGAVHALDTRTPE